jgi:geranylgeranyl pyrophosphate synthase
VDKSEEVINILKEKSAIIEDELKQILPRAENAKTKELKEYYNMLWDYPLRGGKKLRPALCLLGCELFGGNAREAIATAAAIDLFNNGALIHDDIEDGSELRRGKPCLHKIHGEEKAINAGDGTFAKMIEALSRNNALI